MAGVTAEPGPEGTIVTFYSYKGGTGRTMAMANVGWILASNGNRVLMLDWDLEGPGLQHYFRPFLQATEATARRGLIDYFWDAAAFATDPSTANAESDSPYAPDLVDLAEPIRYRFPGSGSLAIVQAGRQDRLFSARVQDFNWRHFYENLGGSHLLDGLRKKLKRRYDWILIDSRTGLSDTSGICTVKLPDILVNCFVANVQSIEGARAVAESVAAQSKKAVRILPLPCRIENSEHRLLDQARSLWRQRHQDFLDEETAASGYWDDVEIPYRAVFAFGETLACLIDTPGLPDTVLAGCERLVSHITRGAVTRLVQPANPRESPSATARAPEGPVRVFLSYARDGAAQESRVREFWLFLRQQGIDARMDLADGEARAGWAEWITQQIRDAHYVLVLASPGYQRQAGPAAVSDSGQPAPQETRLVMERLRADQQTGLPEVLPVVLPGVSAADLPSWLAPASATHYLVSSYTVPGAEALLRVLTTQPLDTEPQLGPVPVLPPRADPAGSSPVRSALRTDVVIEAGMATDGQLYSAVWLAGSRLCEQRSVVPAEVSDVWEALRLPSAAADERMVAVGRRLAAALLDGEAENLLAEALQSLPPGDRIDVVLSADSWSLSLPVELIRLVTSTRNEVGPLALLPGVSVSRRLAASGWADRTQAPTAGAVAADLPGPLKVLAVVAVPDETKTMSAPLDAEAEMQAVLDACAEVAGNPGAQVRILEVASRQAIRQALRDDAYHVLHLSARGGADLVELEDEDGAPDVVDSSSFMRVLREAGRPTPLILLSSCSGGSYGSMALAASLVALGAARVVAMLGPASDRYATTLTRHFYRELASKPALTAGQALAAARTLTEVDRGRAAGRGTPVPEYGLPALLTAAGDAPLIDLAAPPRPLAVVTTPPGGRSVRELPMGTLIGRRTELRTATAVLRRTPQAVAQHGFAAGVQLVGIGGIGKTALAGRVMSRLRDDGWLIAVHEGRWNPIALFGATSQAIAEAAQGAAGPDADSALRAALVVLTGDYDDGSKLGTVALLLSSCRLLVVFDDFEQNLTVGGTSFADPAIDEVLTRLAEAAETGALLFTSRYPLPGPDRFLVQVPVPALSPAELRRLFLRLPAIRELSSEEQRLLARTVGGHPRLMEFVDALLRGGRSSFRHVQVKLRELARAEGVDPLRDPGIAGAVGQALQLGSADILLAELAGLLTPRQADILVQVAVCRAPLSLDDLAFALAADPPGETAEPAPASAPPSPDLLADVDRLADLTLLVPGKQIGMQPWTADLVTRNVATDLDMQHRRALVMRLRRFEQQRGTYDDLVDIPRHLAHLGQYDNLASVANQAATILPGTLACVAYLSEIRPLIPVTERAWVIVSDLEAEALLRAGDLPGAERQLQAILQHVEAQVAAEPGNARRQRDLLVSHNKLGDIATAAGDLTAARAAYQASLEIAARLAAADPANTQWQRDLSVSHNKVGDIATAAGDLAAARASYHVSLDIRHRLATADPANLEWQRDLSISHERIGDIAHAAGDLAAARAAYQASLEIAARLATADPANTQWQRDLSVSHNKVGDIATVAGDLAAARAAYQAGLDIRSRLTAADPANLEWQRDLSVSHNKVGDIATVAGDLAAAHAAYQASLDIRVRLAAADPANLEWQRDLSVSYNKLGGLARAVGDLAAARAAYQASLDICRRLAAADPANAWWQGELALAEEELGALDSADAQADRGLAVPVHRSGSDAQESLAMTDAQQLSVASTDISDLITRPDAPGLARSAQRAERR